MRRMTWLDEILPGRDWQGWCMALALIFYLSIPAADDMRTAELMETTNVPAGDTDAERGEGSL